VVATLCDLASALDALGDPGAALLHLEEAIAMCRAHKLDNHQAIVMMNLGTVHEKLGHQSEATRWLERAWQASSEREIPMVQVGTRLAQAHLECCAGALDSARAKVWEAFAIAERIDWHLAKLACVVSFGEVVACEGRKTEGCDMIRWVLAQDGYWRVGRDTAMRWLVRLSSLSADEPNARPIAATSTLGQVLARVS
jgi:hypothetical protein